jgi:triphosphoribosyl-dephospho-CoA synthetase
VWCGRRDLRDRPRIEGQRRDSQALRIGRAGGRRQRILSLPRVALGERELPAFAGDPRVHGELLELGLLHREVVAEEDGDRLQARVEAQRVAVELEILLRCAATIEAGEGADLRETRARDGQRRVQTDEHELLVALQEVHALIRRGGLKKAKIHAVGQVHAAAHQGVGVRAAGQPSACGGVARERAEPAGARWRARRHQARFPLLRREPVGVLLGVEARELVHQGRVLKGLAGPRGIALARDDRGLVEERRRAPLHDEAHREARDGAASGGERVPGQEHLGLREVRRELRGKVHAAPGIVAVVDVAHDEPRGRDGPRDALGHDAEGGLDDDGQAGLAARAPEHGAARARCVSRADELDGPGRKGDHDAAGLSPRRSGWKAVAHRRRAPRS